MGKGGILEISKYVLKFQNTNWLVFVQKSVVFSTNTGVLVFALGTFYMLMQKIPYFLCGLSRYWLVFVQRVTDFDPRIFGEKMEWGFLGIFFTPYIYAQEPRNIEFSITGRFCSMGAKIHVIFPLIVHVGG